MLKKLIVGFGLLIILIVAALAVLVFTLPTEIKVEREVIVNKPKADVFNYAKMLRNQNEWGPWFKKEATMEQHFSGTDGEPGFLVHWKGKTEEVGEGEQEIKKVVEGERLETELRFKKPFESKADSYLTTEAVSETQTKVKWGFTGEMPRPMNLMLLVIDIDEAIGKDFQQGLDSLKAILEKQS